MNKTQLSFEFFPPKTEEMEKKLWQSVKTLEKLKPQFVSVTYGAGGTTRERTHATVKRIREETSLEPAAHLTCVNATKAEIDAIARSYWDSGIRHIVALRGDPSDMNGDYVPYPGGYEYASDLVKGLKNIADFEISVAAYPEKHPAAKTLEDDIRFLKQKVDEGATRAITQFFFDENLFFKFLDKAHKMGIHVPILPGILPIGNFAQAVKFANMCGTKIPAELMKKFDGLDDKPKERDKVSIEVASKLCQKLVDAKVGRLHFYTLNRSDLVEAVVKNVT